MKYYYTIKNSSLGNFGLIWKEDSLNLKIIKIFLPTEKSSLISKIQKDYSAIEKSDSLNELASNIKKFISGEKIYFNLDLLDLDMCTSFQKKVLITDYKIPRGYVSTYSRIGKTIGSIKGARAVGNALAKNPFPLIIPCHRAIKSDKSLGGFEGGLEMKKTLLENEGIKILNGFVITDKIYY